MVVRPRRDRPAAHDTVRGDMTRDGLRHLLARGVVAALLLPVLLVVLLGLAALLNALGDRDGAVACGRGAIVGGVVWIAVLVGTVAVNAVLTLAGDEPERKRHRPRRGRRRRRPDPLLRERPQGLGGRGPRADSGSEAG